MTTIARCDRCGTMLRGISAPGLCPACLMALAIDAPTQSAISDAAEWESCTGPDRPPPRSAPPLACPEYIGPYHILERVGEGGTGLVFKAEQQEPIRRIVALKVVKLGMDTYDVVARFEAERQALALMNHANVAKVFDAGITDDGRPYFVMEYVRGQPITAYCDHHKLPTRKRLELFLQACEAVHHAHQKAIIHRDIKPSNVLVSVDQGNAGVKVIDFGVAKAISHRLTEHTLATEQGKLIGTPEYMSPEQAEMSGLDVDIRTDIYSLGILLYELLTGALPFDSEALRTAPFDELRRIIREDEPPRPSTRLTCLGEQGRLAAARRETDWRALNRELCSELEWIPLKAMRKDRTERYRSASEMADDVVNYLEGRPLIAGPQGAAYRLRKFVHKHRQAVASTAAMAAIVLGLVVGLAIATTKAIRAWEAQAVETQMYQQEVLKVEGARRDAEVRLAKKLPVFGDRLLVSNQLRDARASYLQSLDIATALGLPDVAMSSRLQALGSPDDLPLMGSFEKTGGVRGFEGTSHVACLALSHDGLRAVTSDEDKQLKLWDLQTGRKIRSFTGHDRGATYVCFSPDDRLIVSASYDGVVRLWDVATRNPPREFREHPAGAEVFVAIFSPDGRSVLSGDTQGNIFWWDVDTRRVIHNFTGHDGGVASLAFAADSPTALSGGRDGTMRLWDLVARAQIQKFGGDMDQVNAVAFGPTPHTAASGSFDGKVRVWDLSKPNEEGQVIGHHEDVVWRIAFSPDGQTVASGGKDGVVSLWDVATRKEIRRFDGQTGEVVGLAFSRDGRMLLSSGDDSLVRVWDVGDESLIRDIPELAGGATVAAVSSEGLVCFGTGSGPLVLCDAVTKQRIRTLKGHESPVTAFCFSPDGHTALSADERGTIILWDLPTSGELRRLIGHAGRVTGLAFLPGYSAVSGGFDGTLRVWDLSNGNQSRLPGPPSAPVTCLTVSADGHSVASGFADGTAKLWDMGTRSLTLQSNARGTRVASVALSEDAKTLLLGQEDGGIRFWDLTADQEPGVFAGQKTAVTGLALLSDGATAWSAGGDGMLRLWDVPSRALVRTVDLHAGAVRSMGFSPDGRFATFTGKDRKERVWDFSRAATTRRFELRLPQARSALQDPPTEAKARAAFGEWFAFRGKDDWAADLLQKARAGGADVSPLALARCYWRLGRGSDAVREFHRAADRGEASAFYLAQCSDAASQAGATAPRTVALH